MPIATPKPPADASSAAETYTLPQFLRILWVSESARAVWQPRLARIQAAKQQFEFDAVAAGILPALLRWIADKEHDSVAAACKQHGLKVLPLSVERRRSPHPSAMGHAGTGIFMHAAIGVKQQAKQLARAWTKSPQEEIGLLLGYPACCSRFYAEAHREAAQPELLWLAAANTAAPHSGVINLNVPPEMNTFWRQLGVSLLPHIPCNFMCDESLLLARRLANFVAQSLYAAEFAWAQEILSWPAEWSTLHGIAEMKTPVFKMSTNAAPAASKRVVRWHGENYPAEGAKGIAFPYRQQLNPAARRFTEGLAVIAAAK